MTTQRYIFATLFSLGMGVVTTGQSGPTGDWPQWQGPDRTGISSETGLLREWPAAGPPVIWSAANLGNGYGSVAIEGRADLRSGHEGLDQHRVRAEPRRRQAASGRSRSDRRCRTIRGAVRAARRRSTAIGSTC